MDGTWRNVVRGLTVLVVFAVAACGGQSMPEPEPEREPPETTTEAQNREMEAEREAERERARRAEEERRRAAERERVLSTIRERVHFDFDKSDIRPDAEPILQRKVTVFREYPEIEIRIEGHCDERGSNEYNLALGQRRAEAVRRYLMSYGIEPSRFTTISYGEERPLREGQNEEAWAANRRAEFVIVEHGRLGEGD